MLLSVKRPGDYIIHNEVDTFRFKNAYNLVAISTCKGKLGGNIDSALALGFLRWRYRVRRSGPGPPTVRHVIKVQVQ